MLLQTLILVTGAISIWLVQDPDPAKARWASVIALIGQPAWLIASWESQQWGVFVVSIIYTISWLRGFRRFWLLPRRARR